MLLDIFRPKKPLQQPIPRVQEDDDETPVDIPANILSAISMLNLKPNEMVMVTINKKVVTKERQDPNTGSKELMSRNTTNSHTLSIVRRT
jgi:hypothetical protein